jgi:hypothetical protein
MTNTKGVTVITVTITTTVTITVVVIVVDPACVPVVALAGGDQSASIPLLKGQPAGAVHNVHTVSSQVQ